MQSTAARGCAGSWRGLRARQGTGHTRAQRHGWQLCPPVPAGAAWLPGTPIVSGCPPGAASPFPRTFRECPSLPRPPGARPRAGTRRGHWVMSPLCPRSGFQQDLEGSLGISGTCQGEVGNVLDTGNVGMFGNFWGREVMGGCRGCHGDTGVALARVGDARGWGGRGGDSKGHEGAWPDPALLSQGLPGTVARTGTWPTVSDIVRAPWGGTLGCPRGGRETPGFGEGDTKDWGGTVESGGPQRL